MDDDIWNGFNNLISALDKVRDQIFYVPIGLRDYSLLITGKSLVHSSPKSIEVTFEIGGKSDG